MPSLALKGDPEKKSKSMRATASMQMDAKTARPASVMPATLLAKTAKSASLMSKSGRSDSLRQKQAKSAESNGGARTGENLEKTARRSPLSGLRAAKSLRVKLIPGPSAKASAAVGAKSTRARSVQSTKSGGVGEEGSADSYTMPSEYKGPNLQVDPTGMAVSLATDATIRHAQQNPIRSRSPRIFFRGKGDIPLLGKKEPMQQPVIPSSLPSVQSLQAAEKRRRRRRCCCIVSVVVIIVLLIVGAGVGAAVWYFLFFKKHAATGTAARTTRAAIIRTTIKAVTKTTTRKKSG